MARRVKRGEIWHFAFAKPDKLRPVLVLTRQEVIELLHTVMVAPITSTIHGAPSEVIVGIDEGLKHDCAVNLDHVQTVEKSRLRRRLAEVSPKKMKAVCRALAIATGC
ncbi:MAG: type II toxin-antitoxin system PemK/MazF family toxin [Spirochaetaceae bacterium]|nr:MAG: type II toxin-antitoxin system PemK/MazF family toxin [Spirochaetaceae bacterium]